VNVPQRIGAGQTIITPANDPLLDELMGKVVAMHDYERRKISDAWADLWADDAVVCFPIEIDPGSRKWVGKEAIVAWNAQKYIERAWTDIDARVEAIAGTRRVVAHVDVVLHLSNGLSIAGPLLIIFTFDEDKKIVLMEEYVNDAHWPVHYLDLATEDEAQR